MGGIYWFIPDHLEHLIRQIHWNIGPVWIRQLPGPKMKTIFIGPDWASQDEKNAQAKEDVEDTKKSLSADEQFLMMLKEKCYKGLGRQ